LSLTVSQREVRCNAEALITITDSLDAGIGASICQGKIEMSYFVQSRDVLF